MSEQEAMLKWQPVVLVLEGGNRLECECGAMAVFVSGKHPKDGKYNQLDNVDAWCQECWTKAVQEDTSDAESAKETDQTQADGAGHHLDGE